MSRHENYIDAQDFYAIKMALPLCAPVVVATQKTVYEYHKKMQDELSRLSFGKIDDHSEEEKEKKHIQRVQEARLMKSAKRKILSSVGFLSQEANKYLGGTW
jgi:esterase/lipase